MPRISGPWVHGGRVPAELGRREACSASASAAIDDKSDRALIAATGPELLPRRLEFAYTETGRLCDRLNQPLMHRPVGPSRSAKGVP